MTRRAGGGGGLLPGVACCLACGLTLAVAAEAVAPRHVAARVLRNGVLTLEVMEPNAPDRYHRGTRFAPLANVLRAVRGGRDFLFSPVVHDPATQNCGLAMEFDNTTEGGPPGFAEAAVGEGFVKIGVGVLRKTAAEYRFSKPYPMIEPAVTTVTWGGDRADFAQLCGGINGYAYKLSAQVRLQASSIVICCRLANTGTKAFRTEQYAHNYFSFAGAPVGPAYVVLFPYELDATGMAVGPLCEGRCIRYATTLNHPLNITVPMPQSYVGPNTVTVRHAGNGQQITATTSMPGPRTFLHASADYLCPEQFIRICLKPGETVEWTRQYDLLSP